MSAAGSRARLRALEPTAGRARRPYVPRGLQVVRSRSTRIDCITEDARALLLQWTIVQAADGARRTRDTRDHNRDPFFESPGRASVLSRASLLHLLLHLRLHCPSVGSRRGAFLGARPLRARQTPRRPAPPAHLAQSAHAAERRDALAAAPRSQFFSSHLSPAVARCCAARDVEAGQPTARAAS